MKSSANGKQNQEIYITFKIKIYEGAISELNIENGKVNAIVSGTDDYEVSMTIDEKGNILTSYCDCPYGWGRVL